jgi:endonuclease YncB( thermonuclease family)
MWRGIGMAVLIAASAGPALAADLPPGLDDGSRVRVTAIVDGATFTVADGRTIRLAALDVPRPSGAGRPASRRDRAAAQARDALAELTAGREVALTLASPAVDRYGRALAHVVDAQGRWVQAEMVTRGLARVAAFDDKPTGLAALLGLEAAAREARRGIWALPEYRVVAAADAARHLDTFQLVEGRIRDVAQKGGRTYLNFGEDWRSDFTVLVPGTVRRRLAALGLDLSGYEGAMVRVRGWIKSYNGPLIEMAQPEQIEVLER